MEEEKNNSPEKEYKEPTHWWVTLIIYLVEIAVATGLVFVFLSIRDVFTIPVDQVTLYRYLADAFTIPGVLFIMLGLLIILSVHGAFIGLGYVFRRMGRVLLPFIFKKDMTYGEYLDSRKEKQKSAQSISFFIVGTVFLIVAIVFIVLFYQVY